MVSIGNHLRHSSLRWNNLYRSSSVPGWPGFDISSRAFMRRCWKKMGPAKVRRASTPYSSWMSRSKMPANSRHQVALEFRAGLEQVETGRKVVGRVEQHDVVAAVGRDAAQQVIEQVAVRVDHAETVAGFDVGEHQAPQQSGLAGAGLADHVQVATLVGHGEPDGSVNSPVPG